MWPPQTFQHQGLYTTVEEVCINSTVNTVVYCLLFTSQYILLDGVLLHEMYVYTIHQ